jgi:hypothetical protein
MRQRQDGTGIGMAEGNISYACLASASWESISRNSGMINATKSFSLPCAALIRDFIWSVCSNISFVRIAASVSTIILELLSPIFHQKYCSPAIHAGYGLFHLSVQVMGTVHCPLLHSSDGFGPMAEN